MELFEFIRILFTDPKKYDTLKNSDKAKNFFMVQRLMAIQYPATSQSLKRVGRNPWAVIDLW